MPSSGNGVTEKKNKIAIEEKKPKTQPERSLVEQVLARIAEKDEEVYVQAVHKL